MVMWVSSALVLALWLVLKVVLHKGGFVHIFLLLGISIFVIQLVAYRHTRYHATASGSDDS